MQLIYQHGELPRPITGLTTTVSPTEIRFIFEHPVDESYNFYIKHMLYRAHMFEGDELKLYSGGKILNTIRLHMAINIEHLVISSDRRSTSFIFT